ncbi:MAG: DUF3604 domain-containing protein, partial [Deltaproteobacteria bacterium]|nr:DUF3604 domain-containing protein [Deltaproteobacteria bacterium]
NASTQGTRNRPYDAYRFTRGARPEVQPYDSLGQGLRTIQLARPLDFAAVAPCGPIPTLLRSDASQDGSGARVELTDRVHAR